MAVLWLNNALNAKYPTKQPVNIISATCKPAAYEKMFIQAEHLNQNVKLTEEDFESPIRQNSKHEARDNPNGI